MREDDGSAAAAPPLLVFAHANSFPADSYRVLLDLLAEQFEVVAPPMLGHAPGLPVSDCWPHLLRELQDYVQQRRGSRQVVLVGHSLGGLLGLMLAARQPPWLRALVLLDAPVIAGWRAWLLWVGKRSGLVWRTPPASAAARRRHAWSDVDEVQAHFGAKAPFAAWDPRMLADYARDATVERDGRRVLRFAREVEAAIYATLPHHLGRLCRRVRLPVAFVGGTRSRELRQAGMRATRRLVGQRLRWIAGGSHLFPFEQPQATAQAIVELLREMGVPGDAPGRRRGLPIMPISRSDTAS